MTPPESFHLILGESPLSPFDFGGVPGRRDGRTALVYLPAGAPGASRISPPSFRERIKQRYWQYEVDVAHHPTWVTLQLPAKEEAFFFTAKVCFTWSVMDPVTVARFGVKDAKPILWRYFDQMLRGISRQFPIVDCGEAETEMNQRLDKESGEIDYGLQLSMMAVDLQLDSATQQHLAERTGDRRAYDLQVLREDYQLKEARLRGTLESEQAQHAHNLELERERYDVKLKTERMKFYQSALLDNGSDFVLLQLMEHPGDVSAVVEMARTAKGVNFDRTRTLFQDLLTNKLVHAADVQELLEHATGQLRTVLDAVSSSGGIDVEQIKNTKVTATTVVAEQTESTRLNVA